MVLCGTHSIERYSECCTSGNAAYKAVDSVPYIML